MKMEGGREGERGEKKTEIRSKETQIFSFKENGEGR